MEFTRDELCVIAAAVNAFQLTIESELSDRFLLADSVIGKLESVGIKPMLRNESHIDDILNGPLNSIERSELIELNKLCDTTKPVVLINRIQAGIKRVLS